MDENGLQFGTVQRSLSEIFLPGQHLLSSDSSEEIKATIMKSDKSLFFVEYHFISHSLLLFNVKQTKSFIPVMLT